MNGIEGGQGRDATEAYLDGLVFGFCAAGAIAVIVAMICVAAAR